MATKVRTSLFSGTVLSAAGATQSSSVIDLSASDAAVVSVRVVNGGTLGAPVVVTINVANDYAAGTPHLLVPYGGSISGGLTSGGGISGLSIDLPQATQALQVSAGGNTTNNATIDVDVSTLTVLT